MRPCIFLLSFSLSTRPLSRRYQCARTYASYIPLLPVPRILQLQPSWFLFMTSPFTSLFLVDTMNESRSLQELLLSTRVVDVYSLHYVEAHWIHCCDIRPY
ncbi:hypothetical protein BOTBODRAFT_248246 [Botryobasidium botryosum FD-172 SS1]|uniref:Uncharacterized protein n=1 Tax=Botryobasidium botryosum (strain FD-172 SS1) TaxID=930990 RepID=A0A067LTS2_BOTB1|nr:hypothetical protein BOTBODRAFT_248246 [Botryobasidium botryosum FD-172 SS1]